VVSNGRGVVVVLLVAWLLLAACWALGSWGVISMIYSMLDAFLGFGSRRLEPSLEGAYHPTNRDVGFFFRF
jgi:hypothetical protein